jgi:signal transduction histidine kinase/ligand-binding sensor domain-containing protein
VDGLFTDAQGTLWINAYDGSMTSLRKGIFTHEWQGGQVSAVFSRSNQVFFATQGGGLFFRPEYSRAPGSWQTIDFGKKIVGNSFRLDADGIIWYLQRDGKIGRVIGTNAVPLRGTRGLGGEKVNCLAADRDGHIWVGTEKQIARWNGNHFEDETPTNGEAVVNTSFLFSTANHGLWALADGMVRHAINRQWTTNIDSWSELLQADPIYLGAYEEGNGDVWLRQFGLGLFHASADGKTERISSADGLPGNRVSCWFQDREGNLWVGIDRGGLVRLRKKQFQVIKAAGGLQNLAVSSVCEDFQGNIWIGSFGGGLNRWRDGKLDRFDLAEGVDRTSVASIYPDATGRLWLSADHDDLFTYETNQITRHPAAIHGIKAILIDHEGRIWMGRQNQLTCWANGAALKFGPDNGFERRDVRALAEDRQGAIWIGTGNGVLYKFANGNFTSYKPDDGLEEQAVWSLLPDDDGSLWVGTFRGGLLRFKDGKFTRYTTRNGLPSDVICQILDDGLGKLWIGSHKGIFSLPKDSFAALDQGRIQTLPCVAYGLYDGLPTLECSGNYQPSCWRGHDGKLWFATVNGVVAVSPDEVRPNQLPPPLVIEDFLVDGKTAGPRDTNRMANPATNPAAARFGKTTPIEITPGKHQLDFIYTALSFTAPDKVSFRYKLSGFDDAWVDAGNKRTAHYGPLPPGEYNFQVIACNNDGVWNKQGDSIAVKQLPFFWQTWWFAGLAGIAIIASVSAAVRHAAMRRLQKNMERLKQQRAIDRERGRIAKDIHDDLGAGLTQIGMQSSLAQDESPDQMRADLKQISERSHAMISTMDEIVWAINPANDTLEALVTYISQYAQEFLEASKLRCRLDLPPQLPAILVSAEARHNSFLAVKETLNNAVKHSQATEVLFQLKIQAGAFKFLIKDNGRGFNPGVPHENASNPDRISSGHGLPNLAERLQQMGGTCVIISDPSQGTEVELTVPIRNHRQMEFK